MVFSRDETMLAASSWARVTRIWNLRTGELEQELADENVSMGLSFDHHDRSIVSGSRCDGLRLRDLRTGTETMKFAGKEGCAAIISLSDDGNMLVTVGERANILRQWNMQTGDAVARDPYHNDRIYSIEFSPKGNIIATGSEGGPSRLPESLHVWRADTGEILYALPGHLSGIKMRCILCGRQPDGLRR